VGQKIAKSRTHFGKGNGPNNLTDFAKKKSSLNAEVLDWKGGKKKTIRKLPAAITGLLKKNVRKPEKKERTNGQHKLKRHHRRGSRKTGTQKEKPMWNHGVGKGRPAPG